MKKTLFAVSILAGATLVLSGCGGSDDSKSTSAEGTTAGATAGSTGGSSSDSDFGTTAGSVSVKVDGKDLTGIDLKNVGCTKQGDSIIIGSGGSSGGVGATLKAGNPPEVTAVGITVDGNALAVAPGMGEAEAKVDGNEYTITGTAQGASMSNPTAGLVKKDFEIKVSCK